MSKQTLTPDVVVKIEKSGNRYNAWDTDGVKRTSEITSGCRKNAYNGNYLLGRFPSTASKSGFAWRKYDGGEMINNTSSVEEISSVEVPTDHAEVLNFIHSSYSLKPKMLMMSELKWKYLVRSGDYGQRYLRLDEADGSDTISVADGVTFVATANIGNEYTSTRVMDKALMDRFTIVEMDVLTEEDENSLLTMMFPSVNSTIVGNVAKIATLTRTESGSDTARITSGISTRTTVELCGLLYDGFSLQEAAEVSIYPQYDNTGGVDSERTFVKQIVQKFCDDGSSDDLFNEEEMAEAVGDDS